MAANAADAATLTVNERILKECHTLYTDPENGKSSFLPLCIHFMHYFLLFHSSSTLLTLTSSTPFLSILHHEYTRTPDIFEDFSMNYVVSHLVSRIDEYSLLYFRNLSDFYWNLRQ